MLIGYFYFSYIKRRRVIHQRAKQKNLEELSVCSDYTALIRADIIISC